MRPTWESPGATPGARSLPDRAGSNVNLTVRLSGSQTIGTVPVRPPAPPVPPSTIYARLTNSTATIDDLRAWVSYRAVRSKTQLLEVLAQFTMTQIAAETVAVYRQMVA